MLMARLRKEAADLVVVARMQRIALHSDLERLKRAVSWDIRQLSAFSDGIPVSYGKKAVNACSIFDIMMP
jgi:hypothetical protein